MFKARRFGSCSSIMQFTSLNKKLSEALCSKRLGSNVHKFEYPHHPKIVYTPTITGSGGGI